MDATAKFLVDEYERQAPLRSPEAAMDRYRRGVDRLTKMIQIGANTKADVVWKNTCDLLIAGRIQLYVLAPRHDSRELIQQKTGNPDSPLRAYFGSDTAVTLKEDNAAVPAPTYDQITYLNEGEEGKVLPGKIAIIDPWRTAETKERVLREELIHEVQHAVSHRQTMSAANLYKEEFTAYAVSGFKGDESPDSNKPVVLSDGTTIAALDNRLQFAIFRHLYNNHPVVNREMNSTASAALDKIIGQKTFWDVVQEFKAPSGINLINSMRIDNLRSALVLKRPTEQGVERARRLLNPEDESAIRSPGMAPEWRKLVEQANLSAAYKAHLTRKLGL